MRTLEALFRLLFFPAPRRENWWCPSCQEMHYAKLDAKNQNWKA